MTFIVNFNIPGYAICKGCTELAQCVSSVHLKGDCFINSIIPINYCKWFYIVYEFEEMIFTVGPIRNQTLYKTIEYLETEGANLWGIHQYVPEIHAQCCFDNLPEIPLF